MTAFSAYQGNDLRLEITVLNEGDGPLDLTGVRLEFVVSDYAGNLVIKKDNMMGEAPTGGIVVVDPVAGRIQVDIGHADTNIPSEWYVYELLVIDAAGRRYTALRGQFTVATSWAATII